MHFPQRMSTYIFGLDAGPDNVGMIRRVLARVMKLPNILTWVVFCLFHQCHLIVKRSLKTVEIYEWPEQFKMEKGYYSLCGQKRSLCGQEWSLCGQKCSLCGLKWSLCGQEWSLCGQKWSYLMHTQSTTTAAYASNTTT